MQLIDQFNSKGDVLGLLLAMAVKGSKAQRPSCGSLFRATQQAVARNNLELSAHSEAHSFGGESGGRQRGGQEFSRGTTLPCRGWPGVHKENEEGWRCPAQGRAGTRRWKGTWLVGQWPEAHCGQSLRGARQTGMRSSRGDSWDPP